jgi:hypothetical protein
VHVVPWSFSQCPAVVVDALHDEPSPHEAEPQHTPLVQKPLGHAVGSVQGVPSPSIGTQTPVLQ